jgi:hypothetical protein
VTGPEGVPACGATNAGRSAGGFSGVRKSVTVSALASRSVSAGRFQLASMVASTEVWSCTTLVTPPGAARGDVGQLEREHRICRARRTWI